MSEKRETILRLVQDATGKTVDVRVEQEVAPKPPTVIELKPETKETFLRNLTEGSVVDWGDGTESTVTAEEAKTKEVKHTYSSTSDTPRVVTIDGVIDRGVYSFDSSFDPSALTAVRSLGELNGEANHLFDLCESLTAIPEGLFDHCTAVTDFTSCFYGCRGLTAIPEGLFANCTAATSFSYCFYYCKSLTAIPEGLFANCTAATSFSCCFCECTSLTTIPERLFANCTATTNFSYCFSECYKLTAIPDGLFDHCTAVTHFNYCFHKCRSLTTIPAGLFDHCTAVTDFFSCFSDLISITGETPYTMMDGKKVKLWERSTENGFENVTTHEQCFYNCKRLSDYAEIPDDWK